MADDMPSTYETTTSPGRSSTVGFHPEYLRTIPGILKIVEIVVSLVVFICACTSDHFIRLGGGWVQFVSIMAFLATIVLLVFHLTALINRLPGPWPLIEFIYYIVFSVLYLIAAIVAAANGAISSAAAAAFFAFAATAVYAVDTFFQFQAWRSGETTTATTTTTTTTTSGPTQY